MKGLSPPSSQAPSIQAPNRQASRRSGCVPAARSNVRGRRGLAAAVPVPASPLSRFLRKPAAGRSSPFARLVGIIAARMPPGPARLATARERATPGDAAANAGRMRRDFPCPPKALCRRPIAPRRVSQTRPGGSGGAADRARPRRSGPAGHSPSAPLDIGFFRICRLARRRPRTPMSARPSLSASVYVRCRRAAAPAREQDIASRSRNAEPHRRQRHQGPGRRYSRRQAVPRMAFTAGRSASGVCGRGPICWMMWLAAALPRRAEVSRSSPAV